MKIVKPDNLALLATPCRLDGKPSLSVAVMACFSLDGPEDRRMLSEAELWATVMARLGEGEMLDQGFPKPAGEFLVHATACAVQPTTGIEITVQVGHLAKTLQVTGDRFWTPTGAPGVPAVFTRLPLTWHNAFGGPGYGLNPLGKGFRVEADGRRPLPNVQYPDKVMTAANETPRPAGLEPYPPDWPQRQSLLGHFDAAWLAERWPDLPQDAAPEYFHTAPEDQRLMGFFRGDEEIRLTGLHPEKHTIVSTLPRLRVRIFVEQVRGKDKELIEVENRAETLMLYPDALQGILLFRGSLPVADEDLDDITVLMAAWEWQAEAPQPAAKYFDQMRAALATPPAPEFEAAPQPEAAASGDSAEAAPPPALPDIEALNRQVAALEADSEQRLRALGMSREELLQKYGVEEKGENVSLESLTAEIEQFEKSTDERLRQIGLSREELLAKYGPEKTGAADPAALQGQVKDLLAQSRDRLAAANLTEADLPGKLPEEIQGQIPSMADAQAALDSWSQASETVREETRCDETALPVAAALNAGEVMARHRAGTGLRGISASGEDFSGCDLQGADFTNAILDRAVFAGARLQGAIFTGAVLQAADFRGADLTGALLRGSSGPEADFGEAHLAGADLTAGDWTGAKFRHADLSAARLSQALLRRADLTGCRLPGAAAQATDFSDACLAATDFKGGDLSGADCSDANLDNACLAEVRAPGLRLFGATARKSDLRGAFLRGARGGPGTVLNGVRLGGVDLAEACLGGAHFIDVDLAGAALDGGDFSRSLFERSNLRNVTARGGSFMKATFIASDLGGIDLLQGSLRHATLEKVDLQEASLYGVDLYGAAFKETDTRGANLQATLLTPPH